MVTGISNATSASTLPLSVRAESAASLLSNVSVAASPVTDAVIDSTAVVKNFRYNSFEFVYKQDFGKIVLLRQEPETGNEIAQFPSEYYLKQYAATARAQRSAELATNRSQVKAPVEAQDAVPEASAQSETAVATPAAATVAASPSPAPAPAARVDIKV